MRSKLLVIIIRIIINTYSELLFYYLNCHSELFHLQRKLTRLIINQLCKMRLITSRARPTFLHSIVYHLVCGAQVEHVSAARQLQRTAMINVNIYVNCARRNKY